MATAARQDDQGNVIQVGEEGAEGEGGDYQDALKGKVPVMIGDEVPLILMILETHPMEEHVDAIPWIPDHVTLWIC